MDPRKAENLASEMKTLWANCGASQFHLPYGETAQRIPGKIGLLIRPDRWEAFCERVKKESYSGCIQSYEFRKDRYNRDILELQFYDNRSICRAGESPVPIHPQPFIQPTDTEWGDAVAKRYGRTATDCVSIEYVAFLCPNNTATLIARFYETVLDATVTVTVTDDDGDQVAVVAVGSIVDNKADQCLIFRETNNDIPQYDGHHIALYVQDVEQGFSKCEKAGVVWINPRFSDKADSLETAKYYQQFRFKDIVDDGQVVFQLEHEVRCDQHEAWLGDDAA